MWKRQICTVNFNDKPKTGSELFWTRQKPEILTYSFATFWKLRMYLPTGYLHHLFVWIQKKMFIEAPRIILF